MYIKELKEISINDIALFGGKNASLGEMIGTLSLQGILVPHGFAISTKAFQDHIAQKNTNEKIQKLLNAVNRTMASSELKKASKTIRRLVEALPFQELLENEILNSYETLSKLYDVKECSVAVRSSASAEDLSGASFAGQHESFLGVTTGADLLDAIKKCMSSLYTERAILYRATKGFDAISVSMSVGVQKMIAASDASSGVSFSIDTETGFKDVIVIESVCGIGESIVQGISTPDLFVVHKQLLQKNVSDPIIIRRCGKKEYIIYTKQGRMYRKKTTATSAKNYTLNDNEIVQLATMVLKIEKHYSNKNKKYTPMDIEWAKDSNDQKIYIIQARPETVTQSGISSTYEIYTINTKQKPIVIGESIGRRVISGTVLCISNLKKIPKEIPKECILVAPMTTPDLIVAIPNVFGIITERGGRTCHAAIISREMNIPAIVGAAKALKTLKNGDRVTIDCSQGNQGFVYKGDIPYQKQQYTIPNDISEKMQVMVTMAFPQNSFSIAQLPVAGVGLTRLEFIIAQTIGIHPLAALFPEKTDTHVRKQIANKMGILFKNSKTFFIYTLRQGIAQIAASFYPRPVIIRFSDFKTNEYSDLVGGTFFENKEENPMLGFRGASRYNDLHFQKAFLMELESVSYLVEKMGLTNIILMVPFIRTVNEGKEIVSTIKAWGALKKIPVYMMIEIPANVSQLSEYASYFNGFSIGSNDLFQLFFGIDRDTPKTDSHLDERQVSFLNLLENAIEEAKKAKKPIGICGQAPSDFPEIADFLINSGISSISLNPDSVLPFLLRNENLKKKS